MVPDCISYVLQTPSSSFSGLGMQIRQINLIQVDLGDRNCAYPGCSDIEWRQFAAGGGRQWFQVVYCMCGKQLRAPSVVLGCKSRRLTRFM